VLAASIPQATYGAALEALAAGYAAAGADGEWKRHYQGGPIGFAQREFEIAPRQTSSRWYSQPIEAWHAIAWNPSLPGGAKAEDTYLVTPDGSLTILSTAPGWPADVSESGTSRPAVLEVDR
jgi:Xaa-Pro dipeptidase